MYQTIFHSLSAHIAVLDENGGIVETNRAWQEYGKQNGFDAENGSSGIDYLTAWVELAGQNSETEAIIRGIQQVLRGEIPEFAALCPCHSSETRRWFNLRLLSCRSENSRRTLVLHEDVTHLVAAREELQDKDEELQRKTRKLKATNIALTIMVEHRNRELKEMEQRIARNIKDLIEPYLVKLKTGNLGSKEKIYVEILEMNLQNIAEPFLNKLAALHSRLSPQQIEIASLVRQGKSSQEIAAILGLSVHTISFHRRNLRRKLGLGDRSKNLRTFLLSLQ